MHRQPGGLLATLNRWPRRILAALCLLLAAASALAAGKSHATAQPDTAAVVIAASDVPAGATLATGALRLARWPRAIVPSDALGDLAAARGQRVAGPIRAGDAVTRSRLVGHELSGQLQHGQVAVALTLADGAARTLLRAGDRVDVFASPPNTGDVTGAPNGGTGRAAEIVTRGLVLAVTPVAETSSDPDSTRLIVATDRGAATRIAGCVGWPLLAVLDDPP